MMYTNTNSLFVAFAPSARGRAAAFRNLDGGSCDAARRERSHHPFDVYATEQEEQDRKATIMAEYYVELSQKMINLSTFLAIDFSELHA
eukprot:scaffold1170_cov122-Cylindrotheca_fusiformis.AAC.5